MRHVIAFVLALALNTAVCAAQSWEHVAPDGLGFAAEFPGKPEYTETQGDDGGKIRTYAVKSMTAAYDMTVWDLTEGAIGPDDVERVLDNIRDQSVQGVMGKLRSESKVDVGGTQVRDVTADTMGMVWRSRIAIANNKIYQLVAIVSKNAEQSEDTVKYMTSFKLLDASGGASKK